MPLIPEGKPLTRKAALVRWIAVSELFAIHVSQALELCLEPGLELGLGLKSSFENPRSASSLDNRKSSVYHRRQFEGRMSSMAKRAQRPVGILQGTLDMLVLRTLLYGPAHGHRMAEAVARVMWAAAEEN
jgi:hypothetical protein